MSCRQECSTCEGFQELAVKIVGDEGAEMLSLRRLGEQSGLPLTLVRAHYPEATACLYDAYDRAFGELFSVFADAFGEDLSWEEGFQNAMRGLLTRLAANPAEARLCFVEAPRVDRELRHRCERRRQGIVEFLSGEYEHRRRRERLSDVHIELLVGASFHAIGEALSAGGPEELAALEPTLSELAGVFEFAAAA
jgi:AcrR family transcriptional regulator